MSQQINLYQPMFRKQRVVFSARTSLALAAGFAVLLALWWLLLDQRVDSLAEQLERQQALERNLAARVAELNSALGSRKPDPVLVDQVERLRQRLVNLNRSRDQIRRRVPDDPVAVSARLESLARRHPAGLWLTGIGIEENGRQIRLEGRMLSAPLLPEFLDRLGAEPTFAGQAFRELGIERAGDGLPGLGFTISTRDPEPQS